MYACEILLLIGGRKAHPHEVYHGQGGIPGTHCSSMPEFSHKC